MKPPVPCLWLICTLVFLMSVVFLPAQDFGFGFDDEAEAQLKPAISFKASGEIAVELMPFVHDFSKKDAAGKPVISFWDILSASGKLNLTLSSSNINAFANFNLNGASIRELWDASSKLGHIPMIMSEAFLQGYIGPVNITAGLRKLTWGKADSLGPLDVINPLDYTDLTKMTDLQAIKIARPLAHVSWNMGGFSKLEGVFIPNFTGLRFASEGRWVSSQFNNFQEQVESGITSQAMSKLDPALLSLFFPPPSPFQEKLTAKIKNYFEENTFTGPDTGGLEYFQAGLRFTSTVGPVDFGVQYFYGNLFRPSFVIMDSIDAFFAELNSKIDPLAPSLDNVNPAAIFPQLHYNRYHLFGVDYAQVLFGFNLRAEFAFNLTKDLKGDDPKVQNPFIGWSFGFDRDLVWGINANVQCNETIRLFDKKIKHNKPLLDCEAGTNAVSTRFTMQLSKKFFRDELECKVIGIWGVEDKDCYIIPALAWTVRDLSVELSAGIFAGEKSGELGQYWENSYIKLGLKYSF